MRASEERPVTWAELYNWNALYQHHRAEHLAKHLSKMLSTESLSVIQLFGYMTTKTHQSHEFCEYLALVELLASSWSTEFRSGFCIGAENASADIIRHQSMALSIPERTSTAAHLQSDPLRQYWLVNNNLFGINRRHNCCRS